jgi:hypothetical protein
MAAGQARARRASDAPGVRITALLGALVGVLAGMLVAVVSAATPMAAAATQVDVDTNPTGAHVQLGHDLSWVEVGPVPGRGHGGAGCHRRWVPADVVVTPTPGGVGDAPSFVGVAPTPDAKPYDVYCDDTYVTMIWATPSQFNGGNLAAALRALAERLVRDLPFPDAGIGIDPDARGLTGLETWYWVTGWDGTPLTDSVSGFGTTVTVEARPAQIVWRFGDGTPDVDADLGRPAPERSSVTHVYERRSGADGMAVQVRFELATRYRVDAGAWLPLEPVERDARRSYPVDEARAQLQRSDA